MRRAAQPAGARSQSRLQPAETHEYAFLIGTLIDAATLLRAEAEALHCGVAAHEVLLAAGQVSQYDYAAALARQLGVPVVSWDAELDTAAGGAWAAGGDGLRAWREGGRAACWPPRRPCPMFARSCGCARERGVDVVLASHVRSTRRLEARLQPERIDRAVHGLLEDRPESSARAPAADWQALAAAVPAGLVIGGFAVVPDATSPLVTALIAMPFLCVTLLRLVALHQAMAGSQRRMRLEWPQAALPDSLLPVYTVLVPLMREANVLPDLVGSLRALDYPPAKLEIFLVLEAADTETQAAVLALELPGNFRILVVPDRAPQTKPKALNYALQFARGDYVVVYDAEDRPQPDQLRRAWEVFRQAPPELGCLQAQLNIYNPARAGSRASSLSSIPPCSMPYCRRWNNCGCRCRSAARRTIFLAPR